MRYSGQGRVHESGTIGEGSRRTVHHSRCRGKGAAAARRRHCRGYGRQYRHRPDRRRQGARLPHGHRHSGYAKPGKEGCASRAWRGTDRGSGCPLQEPEQLRESFRPAGRTACSERGKWRDLGQPVRQCGQSRRPCPHDSAGDLDADRRQGRRFRLVGGDGGYAGRRRRGAQGQECIREDRARRSAGRSALQFLYRGRFEVGRQFDHRRHRPGTHYRQSGRFQRPISRSRSATRRRCLLYSI